MYRIIIEYKKGCGFEMQVMANQVKDKQEAMRLAQSRARQCGFNGAVKKVQVLEV